MRRESSLEKVGGSATTPALATGSVAGDERDVVRTRIDATVFEVFVDITDGWMDWTTDNWHDGEDSGLLRADSASQDSACRFGVLLVVRRRNRPLWAVIRYPLTATLIGQFSVGRKAFRSTQYRENR